MRSSSALSLPTDPTSREAASPLELANLSGLMARGRGRSEIKVGLIDGPVALHHPELAEARIVEVPGATATCGRVPSAACAHGTFVAGILSARRESDAPAICPGCTLLVRPVFAETSEGLPSATAAALAAAILQCIEAGARVLNLSLSLRRCEPAEARALVQALDYAALRRVLIVAAAGNMGELGSSAITAHPWVIPVAASDRRGRAAQQSNLGNSIGRRGLRAPGQQITSLGIAGEPLVGGGTSAAAAFVTGAIALVWSLAPRANAVELRSAFLQGRGEDRRSVTPPLLDAEAAFRTLSRSSRVVEQQVQMETEDKMDEHALIEPNRSADILPASEGQPCGCSAAKSDPVQASFVYVLGEIDARFPRLSVEKEFAQATGRSDTKGLTDRKALHRILSQRENRYLARQMCWVLKVQGLETYLVVPRDPADLDLLIAAIDPQDAPQWSALVGVRGPLAPPEYCSGLSIPLVIFDHMSTFSRNKLLEAIPRAKGTAAGEFETAAGELFDRLMQITDNAGASDKDRALNYLSVRYAAIYANVGQQFDRDFSLTAVETRESVLSGVRNVVEVIFSFRNRSSDFIEKFFVRVDVTDEFPFLITKLSPYYDR